MSEQPGNPSLELSLPRLPRRRHPLGVLVAVVLLICGTVALAEFKGWSWWIVGPAIGVGVLTVAREMRSRKEVLVALAGRPRSGKSYLLAVSGKAQELPDGRRFRLVPTNQTTATLANRYRASLAAGEPLPPNSPQDFTTLSFYVEGYRGGRWHRRWRRQCRLHIWEASGEFLEAVVGTRESPFLTTEQLEELRDYFLKTDLVLLLVDGEVADDRARKEATDAFLLNTCDMLTGLLSGRPKKVCQADAVVLLTKSDLHQELIHNAAAPRQFYETYVDRTTRDMIQSRFKTSRVLPTSALGLAYTHGRSAPELRPCNHLAWLERLRLAPYRWQRRVVTPSLAASLVVGVLCWNAWRANRASHFAGEALAVGNLHDAVRLASEAQMCAERNAVMPDMFGMFGSFVSKLKYQEQRCRTALAISEAESALTRNRFADATIQVRNALHWQPDNLSAHELLSRTRAEWEASLRETPRGTLRALDQLAERLELFPDDRTQADTYVSQIIEQVSAAHLATRPDRELSRYVPHVREAGRYARSGSEQVVAVAHAAERLASVLVERTAGLLAWPDFVDHWPGDTPIEEMITLARRGGTLRVDAARELSRRAGVGSAFLLVAHGKAADALSLLETTSLDHGTLPHRRWVEFLATHCRYEPAVRSYVSPLLSVRSAVSHGFHVTEVGPHTSGPASAFVADTLTASLLGRLPDVEQARSLRPSLVAPEPDAEWTSESFGSSRIAVGRPWWDGSGVDGSTEYIHLPPTFRSRFVSFRCIVQFDNTRD